MILTQIKCSDGIIRSVEGKVFDDEIRVYRIYGDTSWLRNPQSIARDISGHFNKPKVILHT